MAINITLNSFGTQLNDPNMRQSDRRMLYPSIGHLYPAGIELLSNVGDESELMQVLRPYVHYRNIFEQYQVCLAAILFLCVLFYVYRN